MIKLVAINKIRVYQQCSRERHITARSFFLGPEHYQRMLYPTQLPQESDETMSYPISTGLTDCQKHTVNHIFWPIELNLNSPKESTLRFFRSPGTGKIKTVVEVIFQATRLKSSSLKILFCAPSNTAPDMLLTTLSVFLNRGEMFRFMSKLRINSNISHAVDEYFIHDSL